MLSDERQRAAYDRELAARARMSEKAAAEAARANAKQFSVPVRPCSQLPWGVEPAEKLKVGWEWRGCHASVCGRVCAPGGAACGDACRAEEPQLAVWARLQMSSS